MDRASGSNIKKVQYGLIVGLPMQVFQVGSKCHFKDAKGDSIEYKISEIFENKSSFAEYGCFEYEIYISRDGSLNGQVFWKRLIKPPDAVEYMLSDAEELIV